MPPDHWNRLLDVYRRQGHLQPVWHRALMLHWMQEMGMPVASLARALADDMERSAAAATRAATGAAATTATPTAPNGTATASATVQAARAGRLSAIDSVVLPSVDAPIAEAMARVLVAHLLQRAPGGSAAAAAPAAAATSKGSPPAAASPTPPAAGAAATGGAAPAGGSAALDAAVAQLRAAGLPVADALLVMSRRAPASEAPAILERVRADMPTIDRALALVWLHRAMGGAPKPAAAAAAAEALVGPWQVRDSAVGQRSFAWPRSMPVPTAIRLAASPRAGMVALVQYESREAEKATLPVQLERRLYRLKKIDPRPEPQPAKSDPASRRVQAPAELGARPTEFGAEDLGPDEALRTDELYLDVVVLKRSGAGAPLRYGIVEVPLPPGASADRATWGVSIRFPGGSSAEDLERARYEPTPRGYAIPIERLDGGEVVIRHLVRVAQPGSFVLPPARYYRMYEPEQKAFEERHRARVVVR